MEIPSIPPDDLIDVAQMAGEIEAAISIIVTDASDNLALSAFMSGTINWMIGQCGTLDEIVFCRNIYVQMLDSSIRAIKIKKPESFS